MANKAKDWLRDYHRTGRQWEEENKKRREKAGSKEEKGLRNLNFFEKCCVTAIILALIGFFVKIVILGHGFMSLGL